MSKYRVLTAILTAFLLLPFAAAAETWNVDPVHSSASFKIRHFLTKVHGSFHDFSGTIDYDPAKPEATTLKFEIQATSVDTANERRDNHLRSADFFDVESHPTWSFESTKVESAGKGKLKVTGKLTMRGKTHEVTLDVDALGTMETGDGPRAGFVTELTVNRMDYDIAYNRALEGGGTILGDDVEIEISVEAKLASEGEEGEG